MIETAKEINIFAAETNLLHHLFLALKLLLWGLLARVSNDLHQRCYACCRGQHKTIHYLVYKIQKTTVAEFQHAWPRESDVKGERREINIVCQLLEKNNPS